MTPGSLIAEDPDILGGVPCFAGTRVPIERVLASLDKGVSVERLQASWPFLTEAHIREARRYAAKKRTLSDVLARMPNVGRDEDFTRSKG